MMNQNNPVVIKMSLLTYYTPSLCSFFSVSLSYIMSGEFYNVLRRLIHYTWIKILNRKLYSLRKVFDTIEWEFIQRTIVLFNFGDSIQCWISIFYSKTESAVLNNGFCTNYFQLSRGVRQGCPLSPYLFVLAVELLACKIR